MTARNPFKEASPQRVKLTPEEICEQGNAKITAEGRTDIEWRVVNGKATIGWKNFVVAKKDVMDRRGEPMSESDTAELNHRLEKSGATVRYRRDGSRYRASDLQPLSHDQAA